MLNVAEFLFLFPIVLRLAGSFRIIKNSTNWHDALVRCTEQKARLADISDPQKDHICNSNYQLNVNNTYWVGHFYKLSNRISIEGCTNNLSYLTNENRYRSLHDCYELCAGRMNRSGFFAHKVVLGPNCICDLHVDSSLQLNMKMPTSDQCKTHFPFWWIYKVHPYGIKTSNETCRQLNCTESQSLDIVLSTNNCGQFSNGNNKYIRSPVPQDELPYICESNAANSTTSADSFRFGVNASIKQDRIEKSTIILKCEAISCFSSNSFRVIQQNCELNTSGFLCFKESNISHESTSSTTRISSPTMLTISNHINTPLRAPEHNESASYDTTTSKSTSTTTFQQQPSETPLHSSPEIFKNSQGDITSPALSGTEMISKTKGLHTTSSKKYSSLHTSSYVHITYLGEMNNAESTTGSSDTLPSGHSKIGLIVGSAVPTVVIIVAVVLLLSCRLRGWELFNKKKFVDDIQINELNDSNYQDNNFNTEPCDVHNTMNDMQTSSNDNTKFGLLDVSPDNSNNIRNNEYAVMVKNNQSVIQVVEQNCGTNGENSDDPLESEYDKLNHVRPRCGKDSSNIYDSALGFREECDATYNTTAYRGIDKGDDSVYDHI